MVAKDKKRAAASQSLAINGAEAVAYAMRQAEPDVVAAYPITPQTLIIEKFSEYVADGLVRTEFVEVESEHAAMSACIGAAVAGGRAATATAGPGLALMFEMLSVASGMRLPVVLHLATRAFSAPLSILCDHSDLMAMREQGWIIMCGANPQEAYDQAVLAHRIAEHPDVMLPFTNALDGFGVTHVVERVDVLPDDAVREFVGEYQPEHYALKPGVTQTFGAWAHRDYYFELRAQTAEAFRNALPVSEQALAEFREISGRRLSILEPYRLEDAELALVFLGSADGAVKAAVDAARDEGVRAGALRVRLYRPFPVRAVAEALSGVEAVGTLDRALAIGSPGNGLFLDVAASIATRRGRPAMKSFVYGLGGRDPAKEHFDAAIEQLADPERREGVPGMTAYLGLRDGGNE
ncbi:MAG: pyruvate ferredoxin oxidoreductase [Gemmatimonadetes bacterium]|nr:pyruvate ferredoxin oxidoreductase [Gemmatimonadota bacterium]